MIRSGKKNPYQIRLEEAHGGLQVSAFQGEEDVGSVGVHTPDRSSSYLYPNDVRERYDEWMGKAMSLPTSPGRYASENTTLMARGEHPQLFHGEGQPGRPVLNFAEMAKGHQAVGMTMMGMAQDWAQRKYGQPGALPSTDLSYHSARLVGNLAKRGVVNAPEKPRVTNPMNWMFQSHIPEESRGGEVASPQDIQRGREMVRSVVKRSKAPKAVEPHPALF